MKKILLLIDNNENELEFFSEALHEICFPCDCICARDPEVALRLLRYTVPDFIFLEFNIPQMDGLICLKEIKKLRIQESVPVILYSNEMSEEVTKNAMALGAMFCIQKPQSEHFRNNTATHLFHVYRLQSVFSTVKKLK